MLIFLHYLDCISYKQFDTVTTIMLSISPAENQAIKRLKVKCKNSPGHAREELGQHKANCNDNAIVPCQNICLIPSAPAEAGRHCRVHHKNHDEKGPAKSPSRVPS